MFDSYPSYNMYRTLALETPTMKGEDVYALQMALAELEFDPGVADGVLGPRTSAAIVRAQKRYLLVVDGLAGGGTQKALTLSLAQRVATLKKVRYDAMMGQLEWESGGFRLGAYSPPRPSGDFDAGIAQRNTAETPVKQGFDPYPSITALADRIAKHHKLFEGLPVRRRYVLAQGSWNAPAFACYLAREEGAKGVTLGMTLRPSASSRNTFEEYMVKVSKYLQL